MVYVKDKRRSGHTLMTAGLVHSPGGVYKVDKKLGAALLSNPNFERASEKEYKKYLKEEAGR